MGVALELVLLTSQGCGDHQSGWYNNISAGQNVILTIRNCGSTQVQVMFYQPPFNFINQPFGLTLGCQLACECFDPSLIGSYEGGFPCSKLLLLELLHGHESPGILLQCRLWFSRSEVGLEILYFPQTPRSYLGWAGGVKISLWVAGIWETVFPGALLMLHCVCIYLLRPQIHFL